MTVASDWALALDPCRFSRAAGIEPDSWQADVLRSTATRMLLNCSRQSGKSTVVAVLAAHEAIYAAGSLTLCLAPSQRQSSELFMRVLAVYHAVGRPVNAEAETALTLRLENGSRIVALPGKEGTIRSYSGVGLLLIDEASRVHDDTYRAVRPMLAVSQGRLIALSTPFGRRGFWSDAWHASDEPWQRVIAPAEQCPRIAPEFLAQERRALGEWWYEQEYGCQFLDPETSVFHSADIERMFSKGVETWDL